MVSFYTENNVEKLGGTKQEDITKDFLHEVSLSFIAHRPLLEDHTGLKETLV